jgi:hypothetical protein
MPKAPRRRSLLSLVVVALLGASAPAAASAAAPGTVVVTMGRSGTPIAGAAYTFTPSFSGGWVMPDDAVCSWELVWGDLTSLVNHTYNEHFGSILLRGRASDGYCGAWTVTLPYSASAHWLWNFGANDSDGTYYDMTAFDPGPNLPIMAGSNGPGAFGGIADSSLPGVWLSMPKGSLIGDRVTATAHPFGGYVQPPNGANWNSAAGACGCEHLLNVTNHSLTYSFTVSAAGTWTVGYNDTGEATGDNFAGAAIDPQVKAAVRVVLHTPATARKGSTFTVTASAYGFRGTVTYRWYVDHRLVTGGGSSHRFHLSGLGRRQIAIAVSDRFGHKAYAHVWVTVVP